MVYLYRGLSHISHFDFDMILSDLKMIPEHWQGRLENGIIVIGETRDEVIANAAEIDPNLEVRNEVHFD